MGKTKGTISFSSDQKLKILSKWNENIKAKAPLSVRRFALQNSVEPNTLSSWLKQTNKKEITKSTNYHSKQKRILRQQSKSKTYQHSVNNVFIQGEKPTLSRFSKCKCKKKCGKGCSNRKKLVECYGTNCPVGESCGNRTMQLPYSTKIVLKKTADKGMGAFASETIKKGEFLVEYVGEVFHESMRSIRDIRLGESDYIMQLKKGWYVDARRYGNVSRFFNHSCAPSTTASLWKVGNEPRVGLFALRNINVDEELTFSYGDAFRFSECRCSKCKPE